MVRTGHVPREPRRRRLDPQALGRFWEALLGAGPTLTDEPDAFETRLTVPDGLVLDLCFQRVPEPVSPDPRLHLDIGGGARQAEVVQRALELGARHLDIGQHDVPWVVLADPEGNPFCVMEERAEYATSGPIAALPLDSADPARDAAFWAELSGWQPVSVGHARRAAAPLGARGSSWSSAPSHDPRTRAPRTACTSTSGSSPTTTRTPSWPASSSSGARELDPDWGELPWRVLTDPSGNELCLLPARSA